MKVIKVSDEIYDKLVEISTGTRMPISEIATKMIKKGISISNLREEVINQKVLIFDD